ncbi:unnamed protein product [marine sediment metagenome]|uniref:Thioredoxin domain-containing protein n=1 Tax=marine sediment metagenome TaxID=412755 RepID=X0Z033_9ZZZZ
MKTLSYYWHPDCDACEELKPVFKKLANLKGWKYQEINVEKCETKICKTLDYVPTIYVDSKKLDFENMEKLFKE